MPGLLDPFAGAGAPGLLQANPAANVPGSNLLGMSQATLAAQRRQMSHARRRLPPGDQVLRQTGSPVAATLAHMFANPSGPLDKSTEFAQFFGDEALRATGSPLLATASELTADPLNVAGGVGKGALALKGLLAGKMALPVALGQVLGLRRLPPLFHGTGTQANVEDILESGFTKGASAELKTPGTSLSADPTVSMWPQFGAERAENVLRVTPDLDPSQVRNLRPSEYVTGEIPGEWFFNKPSALMFNEAESFMQRIKPSVDADLLDMRVRLNEEFNKGIAKQRDLTDRLAKAIREGAEPGPLTKELNQAKANIDKTETDLIAVQDRIRDQSGANSPPLSPPASARRLSPAEQARLQDQHERNKRALQFIGQAKNRGMNESMPEVARSIRTLRGNRGAFDQGMARLVTGLEDMLRSKRVATNNPLFDAMSEDTKRIALAKLSGSDRIIDTLQPQAASEAKRVAKGLHELVAKSRAEPNTGEVKKVRDRFDDAVRTWVKERNALATRIDAAYPQRSAVMADRLMALGP